MEQAGLNFPSVPSAGLGEDTAPAPLTMADQQAQAIALLRQGYDPAALRQIMRGQSGTMAAPDPAEDPTVGMFGELGFGARRTLEDFASGAGRLAGNLTGSEAVEDTLTGIGEYLGPNEAQDERQQKQAQARRDAVNTGEMGEGEAFARDAGDAILQSAPQLGTSVAGGLAGAAAGTAVLPGVGTVIGGALGALAASIPQLYNQSYEKAKSNGMDVEDPEVKKKLLTGTLLQAAPEAIVPLKILSRLGGPELAQAVVAKSVGRRGLEEFTKDGMAEGVTEVTQEAISELMFNPEFVAAMSEQERADLLPYIIQTKGREAALAFVAGAGLGGAAGGASGAYQQSVQNAARKDDVNFLAQAAQEAGVPTTAFEEAATDPKRVAVLKEASSQIAAAERSRTIAQQLAESDPENEVYAARAQAKAAEADSVRDRYLAQEFGGKTTAQIRADKTAEEQRARTEALEALKSSGFDPDDSIDTRALQAARDEIAEVRQAREQAEEKMATARPSKVTKRRAELDQAIEAEADARERAALRIEGKDNKTARQERQDFIRSRKALGQREMAVEAQRARVFGEIADPEERIAKAESIVKNYAPGTSAADKGLQANIKKLERKLDRADSPEEIAELQSQIDARKERLGLPPPIYEAAKRVLAEAAPAESEAEVSRPAQQEAEAKPASRAEASEPSAAPAATGTVEAPAAQEAQAEAEAADAATRAVQGLRAATGGQVTPEVRRDAEQAVDRFMEAAAVPAPQRPALRAELLAGRRTAADVVAADTEGRQQAAKAVTDAVTKARADRAAGGPPVGQAAPVRAAVDTLMDRAGVPEASRPLVRAQVLNGQITPEQVTAMPAPRRAAPPQAAGDDTDNPLNQGFDVDRQYRWTGMASMVDPDAGIDSHEALMAAWTAETGHEMSAAYDEAGRLVGIGTNGHQNKVAAPQGGLGQKNVTFTHTHPEQTPLSSADISMLGFYGDGARVRAVLPDGQAVEIRKGPRYAMPAVVATRGKMLDAIAETLPPDTPSLERSRIQQEALLRALDAEGVIEYTIPLKGLTDTEEDAINDAVDQALADSDGLRDDAGDGAAARDQGAAEQAGGAGAQVPQAAARTEAERGAVTGVRLATSLAKAYQIAGSKTYRTGRELKVDLQEASLAAQREQGIDLNTTDPDNIDRLADFVVEDALEAVQENSNAIGWYDRTVTQAMDTVAQLYPEIATNPEADFQLKWALAVTSNGLKVDKNFEAAAKAYEGIRDTGNFPTNIGIGTAAPQINAGLAQYSKMLAKFDGDWQSLRDFMVAKVPVREIESTYGVSISGEGKGTLVRGASILGPKIGNGFFSNLYGHFDALTMDRWLMRSVGRWRGGLIKAAPEAVAQKRAQAKEVIQSLSAPELRELQAHFPGTVKPKRTMTAAQHDQLAEEIAKQSRVPAWRNELSTKPGGDMLRRIGNMHAKYLDGQVEAPSGAGERTFIREVFSRGLERLQNEPGMEALTMSDLQALLWYPEKRLYDAAKATGDSDRGYADDEAPDYANAAAKLVRSRGVGDGGRAVPERRAAGVRSAGGAAPVAQGTDTPAVDRDKALAVASQIRDQMAQAKGRSALAEGIKSGTYTPEAMADAVEASFDRVGLNVADVVVAMAAKLDPAYSGEDRKGKTTAENAALQMLNRISDLGYGRFGRQTDFVRSKQDNTKIYPIQRLYVDEKLKRYMGAPAAEKKVRFSAPMEDPNDVSAIKKYGAANLTDGPALARAERTAKHLQAQRYRFNPAYLTTDEKGQITTTLTPQDLVSAKSAVPEGQQQLELIKAERKLERLNRAVRAHGASNPIGFTYTIDKKGRLYPNGEFHHQSGDAVKKLFSLETPDGLVSLGDMTSIDHTGSGWQIAAMMSRDEKVAPLVNIQAGLRNAEAPTKGDIYTATARSLEAGVRAAGKGQPKSAAYQFNRMLGKEPVDPKSGTKISRGPIKTPVIAVNYGGGVGSFRDMLKRFYGEKMKTGGKPWPEKNWNEIAAIGEAAVDDVAPHAKRFKDWAIDSIASVVEALESPGRGRPALTFTVGLDTRYQAKKTKTVNQRIDAADTSVPKRPEGEYGPTFDDSPIGRVTKTLTLPTDDLDARATARNIFSQIIQGFDAAIMHEAVGRYIDKTGGTGPIVTNHDSYTVPPENQGILAEAVVEAMQDVMARPEADVHERLYREIMEQIDASDLPQETKIELRNGIQPPPAKGSYDVNDVATSIPVWVEGPDGDTPPIARGVDDEPETVRRAPAGRARAGGREVAAVQVFDDGSGRPVYEISDTDAFKEALNTAKAALGDAGAQVTAYDDYAGKRLFVFDDGNSGFALDGADVISVFSSPSSPPGAVKRLMPVAVQEGARTLDAFDTYLPYVYGRVGFRSVARLPFNREYAPEGWNYDANGEPDVVFMVYDPARAGEDTDTYVDDYDAGATLQQEAVEGAATGSPIAAGRDDLIDTPEGIRTFPAASGALQSMRQGAIDAYQNPKGAARQALTYSTSTMWEKLEDSVFNRFAPVRRLELALKGELGTGAESAFKNAEMAVNDSGRSEMLEYVGAGEIGPYGEFRVAKGTRGLREIFDMASAGQPDKGQAMADWMGYMAARRIKELEAKGFKGTFPMKDVDGALAKERPGFREAAEAWRAHNNANIDLMVRSGRISPKQADAMKSMESYVPFYRSDTLANGDSPEFAMPAINSGSGTGADILGRKEVIKKLVGGDKLAVDNIMQNMIRNSQAMVAEGMRNNAANKIFDLMEEGGLARTVKGSEKKKPNPNAIAVYRGGKKRWVVPQGEGAEPLMLAMASLQPLQLGRIGQLLAGVGAIFRQGITLSPAFMIRNAIRGAVSTGLLTTGSNLTAGNNTFTGFMEARRNSDDANAFKARTGMGDFRFGNADAGFGKNDILIDYGLGPKTVGYRVRQMVDKLEGYGTATELADRIAAYKTMQSRGVRDDEAAYQALSVMNYGRKGNSRELRALLPMVPFLNARLQGLSRITEGAVGRRGALGRKQAAMQLALNGAVLMAISGMLWARNALDDERREQYKAEPLHRRLSYHIVYGEDRTYLIPKAFELGHLFASIPELFGDALVNDMNDIGPGVKKIVGDTVAMNLIPQAIMPFIEGAANYDFFTQRPIEGLREQSLRPADRTTNSGGVAQFLGRTLGISDATGMSPAMMQHYLEGFGGAYFLAAASAVDTAGAELGLIPARPAGAFGDVPILSSGANNVLGSMIKQTEEQSTKYLEDFYTNREHVTQIYRSAKQAAANGELEYAKQLLTEAPAAPAAYTLINKASSQMSELNAAVRMIQNNKAMSMVEKRRRLRPLIARRNELARQISVTVDKLEKQQGRTFAEAV